jgi:hypothetical protein
VILYRTAIKRIFRRIKYVFTKELFEWPYESCRRCGHCFKVQWNVRDEKWKEVIGVLDEGGGSFCIDCFLEIADNKYVEIKPSDFTILEYFDPFNKGWYKE